MQHRQFETAPEIREAVRELLEQTLSTGGAAPRLVLLSGGSTPIPVYNAIAAEPFTLAEGAHIGFTDERHVPETDPQSNYAATLPMLQALNIVSTQVLRPATDQPLAGAAAGYDAQLRRYLDAGGTIPLAIVGLGADGHTCSLFTEGDLTTSAGHLAAPIERPAPPPRITVSPELLARVERVIVLVAGPDKQAVVAQLLNTPGDIVAGRALNGCRLVEVWQQ